MTRVPTVLEKNVKADPSALQTYLSFGLNLHLKVLNIRDLKAEIRMKVTRYLSSFGVLSMILTDSQ